MLNLSGKAYCHIPNEASFCEKVFVENVRPPLKRRWSIRLKNLLQDGWDKDPGIRPTMNSIQHLLLDELQSSTIFQHSFDVKRRRSTFVYEGELRARSEPQTKDTCSLAASVTTRSSHFSFSGRSD
jgi:hypothetical protein